MQRLAVGEHVVANEGLWGVFRAGKGKARCQLVAPPSPSVPQFPHLSGRGHCWKLPSRLGLPLSSAYPGESSSSGHAWAPPVFCKWFLCPSWRAHRVPSYS